MIGGPLEPDNIRRAMPSMTPAGARFILESYILQAKGTADADLILELREIGKRDKPEWEPRSALTIRTAFMEARGITAPEPRKVEPVVESKEVEITEEGEEKPL